MDLGDSILKANKSIDKQYLEKTVIHIDAYMPSTTS